MVLNAKRGTEAPRQCLSWVNRVTLAVRALLPVFPCKRTWSGAWGMSEKCRYCSLIPGLGVKLSTIILAGPTVLSAVGVKPSA